MLQPAPLGRRHADLPLTGAVRAPVCRHHQSFPPQQRRRGGHRNRPLRDLDGASRGSRAQLGFNRISMGLAGHRPRGPTGGQAAFSR